MRLRLTALVALLALVGCDSNDPDALANVSGTYRLAVLTFDPSAQGLATANVAANLNLPATTLQIFGDDDEALLTVQFNDGQGTRRVNLNVRASDSRVTLSAVGGEDRDDLEDLLLPSSFGLDYSGSRPSALTGSLTLSGVDLEAIDPDQYDGLNSVSGTLSVRFNRI